VALLVAWAVLEMIQSQNKVGSAAVEDAVA